MRNGVDVAQNLQGLSYEVFSTDIAAIVSTQFILVFGICTIMYQHLFAMLDDS